MDRTGSEAGLRMLSWREARSHRQEPFVTTQTSIDGPQVCTRALNSLLPGLAALEPEAQQLLSMAALLNGIVLGPGWLLNNPVCTQAISGLQPSFLPQTQSSNPPPSTHPHQPLFALPRPTARSHRNAKSTQIEPQTHVSNHNRTNPSKQNANANMMVAYNSNTPLSGAQISATRHNPYQPTLNKPLAHLRISTPRSRPDPFAHPQYLHMGRSVPSFRAVHKHAGIRTPCSSPRRRHASHTFRRHSPSLSPCPKTAVPLRRPEAYTLAHRSAAVAPSSPLATTSLAPTVSVIMPRRKTTVSPSPSTQAVPSSSPGPPKTKERPCYELLMRKLQVDLELGF